MSPIYKKKDKTLVENYRPVCVLPTVSKTFKRKMQKQISNYIGKLLFLFLCGYRKGLGTQYNLLTLMGRCKFCLDKQGFPGALLMDLSKAFDTINYELLIAKLHTYGFSINAAEVLLSHLQDRWQRSIQLLVLGLSYFKEFHKGQFFVSYCLIFTSMIYFLH